MHLYLQNAVALARLAAATLYIEGKTPRVIAAQLGLQRLGEHIADVGEHAGVGGRIRAGGAPDGGLVDADHLIHIFKPQHILVSAWLDARAV